MSAGTTPALSPEVLPQRKVPRYKLTVPLHLSVLRSGIPDRISGRTLEIGEGGLGVMASSQLHLGESVRVEFLLPHLTTPVRATAVVRYQREEQCFGLQFLRLPVDQQSIIRYWTRSEGELLVRQSYAAEAQSVLGETSGAPGWLPEFGGAADSKSGLGARRIAVTLCSICLMVAVLGWWRWQQGWAALEAPVLAGEPAKPQLKVPAEAMQQRIRHKVLPEYPEAARQAGAQGTVVLDVVVSPEGAVTQVKLVSGPDALAQAAMDAVRWWRYEPYAVNGRPVAVETTVSAGFELAN
jgi:TonB family protein